MASILLLENNGYYRQRLKNILETKLRLEVCAETDNAPSALRLFREKRPQICIINLMLPIVSGFDFIKNAQKTDPNSALILLSNLYSRYIMEQAMRAGARDIVIKPFSDEEIISVITHHLEHTDENS